MRILVCSHFLHYFTDAEVACFYLARTLLRAGHQVEVACFEAGQPMATLLRHHGLIVRRLSELEGQHFDLIWAQHFTALDYCLLDLAITAHSVVFSSLSPTDPLDSPPLCLERVGLFLANAPETRTALMDMGIDRRCIRIFANPVASEFFSHIPKLLAYRPRLALIAKVISPEMAAALPLLARRGIKVQRFWQEAGGALITAQLLSDFNGIIGSGATVQYGLAMRLPVFCYYGSAGPGWLTEQNIQFAAEYNYSGRCTPTAHSAIELAAAIANGLTMAHRQAEGFGKLAREHYSLKKELAEVLVRAKGLQGLIAGPDCVRAVALRQRDYYLSQGIGSCG